MEILLDAPVGSPGYEIKVENEEGSLVSSPRPASEEEAANIRTIREMQRAIRKRVGSRREPTVHDMAAILIPYGANWETMVPNYLLAVLTMDQGLSVP